ISPRFHAGMAEDQPRLFGHLLRIAIDAFAGPLKAAGFDIVDDNGNQHRASFRLSFALRRAPARLGGRVAGGRPAGSPARRYGPECRTRSQPARCRYRTDTVPRSAFDSRS